MKNNRCNKTARSIRPSWHTHRGDKLPPPPAEELSLRTSCAVETPRFCNHLPTVCFPFVLSETRLGWQGALLSAAMTSSLVLAERLRESAAKIWNFVGWCVFRGWNSCQTWLSVERRQSGQSIINPNTYPSIYSIYIIEIYLYNIHLSIYCIVIFSSISLRTTSQCRSNSRLRR